jgi:predicted membrane protein
MKLFIYIALIWITSFTVTFLIPLTFIIREFALYIYIMLALIFSSLNTILIYLVMRDYYMGVNLQSRPYKEKINIEKEDFDIEASNKNDSNPFDKYIDKFKK